MSTNFVDERSKTGQLNAARLKGLFFTCYGK